jgi:hypothetical protein
MLSPVEPVEVLLREKYEGYLATNPNAALHLG